MDIEKAAKELVDVLPINKLQVKPSLAVIEIAMNRVRAATLEEAAQVAERYAEAAKVWGFKCDASEDIRGLYINSAQIQGDRNEG